MPVIYSPLSDSELDSICLSLVNQNLPYFSAFHEAFVLLYLTGCRVDEIFDISRWERLTGYEMRFLPQKDNYHRYVTLDSRCDNFISAVINQYKPFGGLSSGQLNSVFYNFSEYSNFKVGSKPVSLYLFRYNFIRRLHADGLNINQIADKMGYTSTAVVGGYLTAEIAKGFFLDTDGFVNINGTWFSQSYFDVNDGGTGIIVKYPFSDGLPITYYTQAALLRVLSSNTQYRLWTYSDYNLLYTYLRSFGLYFNALCVPDTTYWTSVIGANINLLDFGLKGCGRVIGSNLYDVRNNFEFHFYNDVQSRYRNFFVTNNASLWTNSGFNTSIYYPARVILVI